MSDARTSARADGAQTRGWRKKAGLAVTVGLIGLALTHVSSDPTANRESATPHGTRRAAPDSRQTALPPALRLAYVGAVQSQPGAAYDVVDHRAHNPAAQLTTHFGHGAIELTREGHAVSVSVERFGCHGATRELEDVAPQARDNRVEYARDALTEWYLNGPLGLEQGFTIERSPECGGELELDIGMKGTLSPHARDGFVSLRDEGGRELLAYGDLLVIDATGRELPAQLDVHGQQVALRFDASHAVFPVVVDPTFALQQKLASTDPETNGDYFGRSVAVSGDTAVIGTDYDENGAATYAGSVYVFVRSGGVWTLQQKLQNPDPEVDGDAFGISVAISGDTLLVGAAGDENGAAVNAGSAFVFVRSGSVWTLQQKLQDSDLDYFGDNFGYSVALQNDTAVVGALYDKNAGSAGAGSASVFVRSGSTWTLEQKLQSPDPETNNDQLGRAVGLSNDTVIVGAWQDENGAATSAGSAYVFVRSGNVWSFEQKLQNPDAEVDGDIFGDSVAISGDTAIVGADQDENSSSPLSGSAFVFVRSGNTWSLQQKLTNPDPETTYDSFGISVAISGDTAIVGAFGDENGGSAFVFSRTGSSWTSLQKIQNTDPETTNDYFGSAIALSSDTAVIAAFQDENGASAYAGSAFVYNLNPALQLSPTSFTFTTTAGVPTYQVLTLTNTGDANLVISTVNIGDVNAAYSVGTGTCPSLTPTLAPGASCTMNVTFSKSIAGTYNAMLSFSSNDPNPATFITLSGTASPAPAPGLALDKPSVTFSAAMNAMDVDSLTLTNTGSLPLTVSSINLSGATGQLTFGAGTCGSTTPTLAPGASCALSLAFMSSTLGTFNGTLTIASNAPSSPTAVALTGTATPIAMIPTLSEWGMIVLAALLAATMALATRRKKA